LELATTEFVSSHRPEMRLKHIWLAGDIAQLNSGVRVCTGDFSLSQVLVKRGDKLYRGLAFAVRHRIEYGIELCTKAESGPR
jgi:hypothetical protein